MSAISPVIAANTVRDNPRRTLTIRPRQGKKPEYAVTDEKGEKTVYPSIALAWRALDIVA
jgi:hypothetical protein